MRLAHGINGINNGCAAKAIAAGGSNYNTTQAWRTLSQYLPDRDPDSDFWWKFSGPRLALMLEHAGYSAEKQLEALVFFYHWTVSTLPIIMMTFAYLWFIDRVGTLLGSCPSG